MHEEALGSTAPASRLIGDSNSAVRGHMEQQKRQSKPFGKEDSEVQVALTDRSGGVRKGQAVGLVRADTTSMQMAVPSSWRLGAWPAKGMWRWGLSAGKSSPTPRSPRATLLNTLA